ncbi:DUF2969 family protein [Vagococcus acidifermentans]|uniref:DUF2969 domain-containing protein n=1 Tax=Vagococcus acidifermentans TaxID=564710 RepID=A0A430ATP3_9ENTE|nr:DUF2969 family protein [Vagococcus acidifermentans]RSU11418.1 hypothetical protein CBF27_07925 [Vagococcus acidifermentans]
MKKNKSVEVTIKEADKNMFGQPAVVHQLYIGKKMIGEVEELSEGKYGVTINNQQTMVVKSFESGYEEVIRVWNLEH